MQNGHLSVPTQVCRDRLLASTAGKDLRPIDGGLVYAPVRVSGLQASIECSVSRRGTIRVATSGVLCVCGGGEERWRLKGFLFCATASQSRFASSTGSRIAEGSVGGN